MQWLLLTPRRAKKSHGQAARQEPAQRGEPELARAARDDAEDERKPAASDTAQLSRDTPRFSLYIGT